MKESGNINILLVGSELSELFKENYGISLEPLLENVKMAYTFSVEPIKLPDHYLNVVPSFEAVLMCVSKEMKRELIVDSPQWKSNRYCYLNLWIYIDKEFLIKNIPNGILTDGISNNLSAEKIYENFIDIYECLKNTTEKWLEEVETKLINVRLKDIFIKTSCSKLMFEIINNLINMFMPDDSYNHKSDDVYIIKKLEREMRTNYNKSNLSINYMAQYAGMSPTKFKRVFKDIFGHSPHQYILDIRASQAKKLLESNHYTISQIAYKVGFNYPSGLTRLIKTKYNASPLDIMKKPAELMSA
jgi:AraC-like DNA-binding protein